MEEIEAKKLKLEARKLYRTGRITYKPMIETIGDYELPHFFRIPVKREEFELEDYLICRFYHEEKGSSEMYELEDYLLCRFFKTFVMNVWTNYASVIA